MRPQMIDAPSGLPRDTTGPETSGFPHGPRFDARMGDTAPSSTLRLRAIVAEFDNGETRPEGFPEARAERWRDATGD